MQLCYLCQERVRRQLDELPGLLREATTLSGDSTVLAGLAAGPTGVLPRGDRITGSTQAATPVAIGLLNIVGPGSACVSDEHGDQHGDLPLWKWLADWCADWAAARMELCPQRDVWTMADWLRRRVDWAGLKHSAIADFTVELARQHAIVRIAAGHTPELPELCVGVSCPACNGRTLSKHRGDVTCARCGYVTWGKDYDRMVRKQAAPHMPQDV
jgi:hypothetical protein